MWSLVLLLKGHPVACELQAGEASTLVVDRPVMQTVDQLGRTPAADEHDTQAFFDPSVLQS